jgi:hypothetical protein
MTITFEEEPQQIVAQAGDPQPGVPRLGTKGMPGPMAALAVPPPSSAGQRTMPTRTYVPGMISTNSNSLLAVPDPLGLPVTSASAPVAGEALSAEERAVLLQLQQQLAQERAQTQTLPAIRGQEQVIAGHRGRFGDHYCALTR